MHYITFTNVFNVTLTGMTFLLFNYKHDRELALFVYSSIDVTISNMIFLGSGDLNSPLAHAVHSTASNITITDSLFEGNTGLEGGAIHATEESHLVLMGNRFYANNAKLSGGAIALVNGYVRLLN